MLVVSCILHLLTCFRGTSVFSFSDYNISHGAADDYTSVFIKLLTRGLYDEHAHSTRCGFNAADHLTMSLILNIVIVDLNDPISLPDTSCLSGRSRVNLPDELSRFALLCVQVEAESLEVRPNAQDTEPRAWTFIVVFFSSSIISFRFHFIRVNAHRTHAGWD